MVGWTKEHTHAIKTQVFFSRLGNCYGERPKKSKSRKKNRSEVGSYLLFLGHLF